MREYHKIDSIFKRDPANKNKTFLIGEWAQEAFGYLANNEWVFTEKVDGTNIRVMCPPYQEDGKQYGITFGGRTEAAQIPAFLVQRLIERFHGEETRAKLAAMFPESGACLYGEGYGHRIQKDGGRYRADSVDFVLFDVKVGDVWLERHNVEDIAAKLDLDVAPLIGFGTLHDMLKTAQEGFQSRWGNFTAEGIVARPRVELRTRAGQRIITKVKHKDFIA
jgi:ATP-dependent RNA circularization protein (DNA/RNA ligase family)